MKISRFQSTDLQPQLFPQPLGNHGHVRTVVGSLMERLTAEITGGRRHITRSGYYCPDVSLGSCYLESKSAGKSNQIFIYGGRLIKDRAFAQSHCLIYMIWHHTADTKQTNTVESLESLVLGSIRELHIVPFENIDRICSSLREERLNSRYGSSRAYPNTYGTGYRIPLSTLPKEPGGVVQFPNGVTPEAREYWKKYPYPIH